MIRGGGDGWGGRGGCRYRYWGVGLGWEWGGLVMEVVEVRVREGWCKGEVVGVGWVV